MNKQVKLKPRFKPVKAGQIKLNDALLLVNEAGVQEINVINGISLSAGREHETGEIFPIVNFKMLNRLGERNGVSHPEQTYWCCPGYAEI